jgi:hypothetical protein
MNPNDPNASLLERAAEQLGEALLEQLVFVGGASRRTAGQGHPSAAGAQTISFSV